MVYEMHIVDMKDIGVMLNADTMLRMIIKKVMILMLTPFGRESTAKMSIIFIYTY